MLAHQSRACIHALEFVAHHVPAQEHHFFPGFHRPLRVVPPSATPSQQHTPSPLHSRFHPVPSHAQPPAPPPYTSRYFPSHFFPEKMYHYWFVPQDFTLADQEFALFLCFRKRNQIIFANKGTFSFYFLTWCCKICIAASNRLQQFL